MIGVRCPQCQAEFSVKPKFVGKVMKCRKCRGPVPVPPPGWTGEPLPPASEWSTFWSYLGATIFAILIILVWWEKLTRHSSRDAANRESQQRMQEHLKAYDAQRKKERDELFGPRPGDIRIEYPLKPSEPK